MKQFKFKKAVRALLVILFALMVGNVQAQGRAYIRNCIASWGKCRNVAITKTNGDLAIRDRNAVAMSNLPKGLEQALEELNDDGELIDDVVLTESGRYLILYGDNGFIWNDIPYSLERKLREYNDDGEVVLSVTFNDDGDWVVISKNYYSTSDSRITQFLKEGAEEHGMLWSVCITDDALVAVFASGIKTAGNVPADLTYALRNTTIDVYRLKIAGNSWFFADLDGHFRYSM